MENTLNTLSNFLTRDNITLLLALLGCIGSIFSWLYTFFTNRKNIDIRIVGRRFSDFDSESLLLYMSFVNKSRLSISITAIGVKIDGIIHSCQEIPVTALEEETRCAGKVISHNEYKSMTLPISLAGLSWTSGYVYFSFPEVTLPHDATHLTFQVSTNRGKAIEKTLSLGLPLD